MNDLGILAPDWSPDGNTIAVAAGLRGNSTLTIVSVADKAARPLYRYLGTIGRPLWTPDGTAILIPLDTLIADRAQIWRIAYPGGAATRFTNDLADYSRQHFDRTADGKTLAIVSESRVVNVDALDNGPSAPGHPLTSGGGAGSVSWGGDNGLYFTVGQNVFYRAPTGSPPRQLTTEGTVNLYASACGDGSVVYQVFKENRTEIWRMAPDGSNAHALVKEGNPVNPTCAPDSTWITYVTPLTVVPSTGGAAAFTLRLPAGAEAETFSPDGKAIQYALVRHGAGNIWEQPLTGGQPRQITSFTDPLLPFFSWSRDGKRLAVTHGRQGYDIVLMTNFK